MKFVRRIMFKLMSSMCGIESFLWNPFRILIYWGLVYPGWRFADPGLVYVVAFQATSDSGIWLGKIR